MVLNSFLAKKSICGIMLSHPAAKLQVRPMVMGMAQKYGHIFVRLFGYPLETTVRMRARTVIGYLPKERGKLLDIGCSFGVLAFELARRGYQVTGVDVNPVSIELANQINEILKLKNVSFSSTDFIGNRFLAGEFDIVVMVEALEHIQDDRHAIDEIHRILREGGVFIVSVPYAEAIQEFSAPVPSWHDFEGKSAAIGVPGELHYRSGYNLEGLISLLGLSGFSVVGWRFTREMRILPKSMLLFPLCYIAAQVLNRLSKHNAKPTVVAKKESPQKPIRAESNLSPVSRALKRAIWGCIAEPIRLLHVIWPLHLAY